MGPTGGPTAPRAVARPPGRPGPPAAVGRTQALVLGFFALAWVGLVAILVVAPGVFDRALKLPEGDHRALDLLFLLAISAFLVLLAVGVLRRRGWAFWVILVAFLGGLLRPPAAGLELAGVLPAAGPAWYAAFQAVLGLVQFAIGVVMLRGYRRGGVWGDGFAGSPGGGAR